MKSMIWKIFNERIKSFQIDADGICIEFLNEIKLIIYNSTEINIKRNGNFSKIINSIIEDVYEDKKEIVIKTDVNITILIDLSDDAYSGPEAMQMIIPDGPIVVWN
jgi:hypothetical protein